MGVFASQSPGATDGLLLIDSTPVEYARSRETVKRSALGDAADYDLLTLERHGAGTLPGLRERVIARFCCLAAAITLNYSLGHPRRALVNYCT